MEEGHAVAIISKESNSPVMQGPEAVSITTSRRWSQSESEILTDVMTNLLQPATIVRDLFPQAANLCRLRGVKVCIRIFIFYL